jgi:hypothetical protein
MKVEQKSKEKILKNHSRKVWPKYEALKDMVFFDLFCLP